MAPYSTPGEITWSICTPRNAWSDWSFEINTVALAGPSGGVRSGHHYRLRRPNPMRRMPPRNTATYLYVVAQNQTVSEMAGRDITVCIDAYPRTEGEVFRIGAADDILRLLVDAHQTEFTIPELVDATGVTRSTVWRAVDLLDAIGVVRIRETPQRNYVAIDPDRLRKDDPVLAIPQSEFHEPVRAFVDRVQDGVADADAVDALLGVVVFGSVARGDADRRSDVDLFVLVDGDRTTTRRLVADVVADLRTERFDGDRFAFEPYVESAESAHRAGSKLRDVFAEGITVSGSDRLHALRKEVVGDE